MAKASGIESPCVDICVIDPSTRLCRGCRRSIDEIAGWSGFTPGERRRIMATLETRAQVEAGPVSGPGQSIDA